MLNQLIHGVVVALALLLITSPPAAGAPPVAASSPLKGQEFLEQYCVTCHNAKSRIAGLALDELALTEIPAHAQDWEHVVQKLRSGTMPPAGIRRPERPAYDAVAGWLEQELDQASAARPFGGQSIVHRLNRTEYSNSIRDLLGLEVDVTALLPPDDAAFGFDNVSDMLGVSPSLQERYLKAALKIAALAVGDGEQAKSSQTWRIRRIVRKTGTSKVCRSGP